MAFYLLRPLNLDEPDWALSVLRSPIQVNAEEEPQARHAAAEQLCSTRTDLPLMLRSAARPWLRRDRAACEQIARPDENLPLIEGYHPKRRPGRPSKQFLYLLTPISHEAPDWELSTSTDAVCVRARNPAHARAIAAMRFDISNASSPDLIHPWWNPRLVKVTELTTIPDGVPLITGLDKLGGRMRHKG